ncbi:MAG: hypothetical protein II124_04090, partial [Clostridia bacterium]|nr:hypothetical protein [Clostridia bacterium]
AGETYDLTEYLTSGTLYGGYYKKYNGASSDIEARMKAASFGWADVNVDTLRATENGQVRQTGKNDAGGRAYVAENMQGANAITWDWDDSYNVDTLTTDGEEKAADPRGNAIKPEAGKVYYIKEVPASLYLKPHVAYTYRTDANYTVTKMWLVSDIDDVNYQLGGFVVNGTNVSSTGYVPQLTVVASNGGATHVMTPGDTFDAPCGYLTYKSYAPEELANKEVGFFWVTPDGMLVIHQNRMSITGTDTVAAIETGTTVTIYDAPTVVPYNFGN